ncbi:MAG: (cytosine-5)-methyltransferase 1 Dcm1, partial [Pseudomonadota bacterium]
IMTDQFKFIDLFSGIGGFHLAMHSLGGVCVFASEIDVHARKTYEYNFKKISPQLFNNKQDETINLFKLFNDDIRSISPAEIPDFDILCGGFPCQPFSQAGHKRGFNDNHKSERGNLFFNIVDIIKEKKPKAFFLENVRGIVNHDNGNTFKIIREILEVELGYSFYFKVVKACDYGLPQLRPRTFMIGFRDEGVLRNFVFPPEIPLKFNMSDVFQKECSREIGFTIRVGGRGSPINDRRNWDAYWVGGEVVKLMPPHALKMQGFPDNFELPVSNKEAMKQLGNTVAVDAVRECAKAMIEYMKKLNSSIDSFDNIDNFDSIQKNSGYQSLKAVVVFKKLILF